MRTVLRKLGKAMLKAFFVISSHCLETKKLVVL